MEDIEAIIDASKHFKYHEPSGSTPFNRISSLPESKKHLKRAIKERIQLLVGAYISLASFIDDDLVDFLEECDENLDEKKIKEISKIYKTVLKNMDRLRKEMEDFDPFELPTDSTRDALDS